MRGIARLANLERDAAKQLTDFEDHNESSSSGTGLSASQRATPKLLSTNSKRCRTAKASSNAADTVRIALDTLNRDIANTLIAREAFSGAQQLVSH